MSSKTERDDEAIRLVVASLAAALGYYWLSSMYPNAADAIVGNILLLVSVIAFGLAILFIYDLGSDFLRDYRRH